MKWALERQVCTTIFFCLSDKLTVETIGIIMNYWNTHPADQGTPILIVSPTDLVAQQWYDAFENFAKGITAVLCTSSNVCTFHISFCI